ncbi:MAG: NAD(P)/FAD-dependent oxidoreductase [Planctomycetaceae bacterium]
MKPGSLWEEVLPAGAQDELVASTDVLIVGGGFLGLWLARFLRDASPPPSLLLLDREPTPRGASTRNAGFLTCGQVGEMAADRRIVGDKAVVESFLLRREGAARILREFGGRIDLDPCGSADFDGVTGEREELAALLNGMHPTFRTRTLEMGGVPRRVFVNPGDAGIHPGKLLACLEQEARGRGARVARGVAVRSLGDGRAVAAGRTIRYGHAFVCTNAFADELCPASEVLPGRGQVLLLHPCAARTAPVLGFLRDGYDYFRFVEGRLLVGGGRDLAGQPETTRLMEGSHEVRAHLEAVARTILGSERVEVERHWAGIMGFPAGRHLPAYPVRRADRSTTLVAGCGGMGVALAPAVAQRLAAGFRA